MNDVTSWYTSCNRVYKKSYNYLALNGGAHARPATPFHDQNGLNRRAIHTVFLCIFNQLDGSSRGYCACVPRCCRAVFIPRACIAPNKSSCSRLYLRSFSERATLSTGRSVRGSTGLMPKYFVTCHITFQRFHLNSQPPVGFIKGALRGNRI